MKTREEEEIDYQVNLIRGKAYETAIEEFFKEQLNFQMGVYTDIKDQYTKGESRAKIEIKFDNKSYGSGNLYIEVAEKKHSNNTSFVDSGIYRKDNSVFYLIGNHQEFFLFPKTLLENIHKNKNTDGLYKSKDVTNGTSKGFLLNIKDVKAYIYKTKAENCLHFKYEFAQHNGLIKYTDQGEQNQFPSREVVQQFYWKHINDQKETKVQTLTL
ncbi:MAG: hypothetical protein PHW29_04465 [Flavobacterium sp.]|nr:hypothetical protein [Flavobacterium sp.]